MCSCGCNICNTKPLMLNESLAPKQILSEGLKYHMDNNRPLTEHVYRAGSENYFNLWAEARSLYSRGILEITNEDDLAVLTETHLGHFGVLEDGTKVPLDFPLVNEQGEETSWSRDEDKITLQDILELTKDIKIINFPTEKLANIVLNWDNNPEEIERISQVEVSSQYPILIMVDESGKIQWILDGNHRAQKALRSKSKTIPAKLIKPSDLNPMAKKIFGLSEAEYKGKKVELNKPMRVELTEEEIDALIESYQEKANKSISENRIIVKTKGKRLAIDKEDLQRLKSGKDIVGYSTKYPGQEEWILAKDKWEIEGPLNEAKKKSKKKNNKPLNKPMRDSSGGKAYKVYVKDPKTGNIKTVRFGSGGLRAKINDPKARQAFAKRHKCSTKKDKTKASYWSCRLPRYAKLLGLKSNFSGFW